MVHDRASETELPETDPAERRATDGPSDAAMKLLFVTSRPPFPVRRGDQARSSGLLRELAPRHRVAVLALEPLGFPPCPWPPGIDGRVLLLKRPAALAALLRGAWPVFGGLPLQVAWHRTAAARRAVAEAIERQSPDVLVPILSRTGWACDLAPEVPAVIDLVDSMALNLHNRAERQKLLGPVLRWEARRIDAYERRLARRVRFATVVSERDREAVVGGDPVLAARVRVVPVGVPVPDSLPARAGGGKVVLLSGNLGYFPTVDGAVWFGKEVWPQVRRRCPEAEWWLAGARPGAAVRRLAALPGVRILPDPDDLVAVQRQAQVSVAPLLSGSGTANKMLEAMAAGIPVVTTPAGAAGLDGAPPEVVRVAGRADDLAEHVAVLLGDRVSAEVQRRAAWEWVRRNHAVAAIAGRFEELLEKAFTGG